MASQKDLQIEKGKTFKQVVRWETLPIVYVPITNITKGGPAIITATAHGLVNGWRAAVSAVLGMVEINALNSPPKAKDYHIVTVVDVNTISLNDVNSAGFTSYLSGGVLQYNTAQDMTGYTAQMSILDSVTGSVIQTLTSAAGDIVIDNTGKTITINMNQTNTGLLSWSSALYELDMLTSTADPSNPTVTPLLYGSITAVAHL